MSADPTVLRMALHRGRDLTGPQSWALLLSGLAVCAGAAVRSPWCAPLLLPVALVAPGYAVLARLAAAVEHDPSPSGEGLWRTFALRVVVSVALWTALPTLAVVSGRDPVLAVAAVGLGLVAVGAAGLVTVVRTTGVPAAAVLRTALRTWCAVLSLPHVVVPVVAAVVVVAALAGAVRIAAGGGPGTASSRAPFVSLSLAPTSARPGEVTGDVSGLAVVVAGSAPGTAGSGVRDARLEVVVDGIPVGVQDVTVPASGSQVVRLVGSWPSCWRRAEVRLAAGTDTSLARLLPRPLTLDGPGLLDPACRAGRSPALVPDVRPDEQEARELAIGGRRMQPRANRLCRRTPSSPSRSGSSC